MKFGSSTIFDYILLLAILLAPIIGLTSYYVAGSPSPYMGPHNTLVSAAFAMVLVCVIACIKVNIDKIDGRKTSSQRNRWMIIFFVILLVGSVFTGSISRQMIEERRVQDKAEKELYLEKRAIEDIENIKVLFQEEHRIRWVNEEVNFFSIETGEKITYGKTPHFRPEVHATILQYIKNRDERVRLEFCETCDYEADPYAREGREGFGTIPVEAYYQGKSLNDLHRIDRISGEYKLELEDFGIES